jgi:hypothetical protein
VSASPYSQEAKPARGGRDGDALAMTVLSPLRPGGKCVQRLVYAIGRIAPSVAVDELGLIHFARLALIDEFPQHGQPPDDLGHPLQLFESNYNGSFGQYIDTFVDFVRWKMRAFWATSYGFPLSVRPGLFKRYINANLFPVNYYYARNPDTTVKTVSAALQVAQANAQLRRDAPQLGPAEFAGRFRTLVTDLQADL